MALNNNREQYLKILKKTVLFFLILVVFVINVFMFNKLIATNPEKITTYQTPEDVYAPLRNPEISVTYYSLADKSPKIVVLPYKYCNQFLHHLRKNLETYQLQKIAVWMPADKAAKSENFNAILPENVSLDIIINDDVQESLAGKLLNYLNVSGNFVVLIDEIQDNQISDVLGVAEDVAAKLNLRPVVRNLSKYQNIPLEIESQIFSDKLSLDQQYSNLESFIYDYKDVLQDFMKQLLNTNSCKIKSAKENKHLWDKAAVYVLAYDLNKKMFNEYGSFNFEKSVKSAICYYVKKAKENMPNANVKVFLLTERKGRHYAEENDFIAELQAGEGVFLQDGKRKGIMLPYFWNIYSDKKEFVNQLKLKSGLHPDYWSEKIEIYYFKAAEIPYHAN